MLLYLFYQSNNAAVKNLSNMKTYNVQFNDSENSNDKGFQLTIEDCKNWINSNKTNDTYFRDYAGGTVSIVCNETGNIVFEENI